MENANNKNQSYKTKQNRGLLTRQQITDHHYARDARLSMRTRSCTAVENEHNTVRHRIHESQRKSSGLVQHLEHYRSLGMPLPGTRMYINVISINCLNLDAQLALDKSFPLIE